MCYLHFDVRIFCYRGLRGNKFGPKGGIAIAEALKINTTITTIE
jgi:hypothetical protein